MKSSLNCYLVLGFPFIDFFSFFCLIISRLEKKAVAGNFSVKFFSHSGTSDHVSHGF